MKRLLVQAQLSNYTREGEFILECDSGWQMCVSRINELLRLIPSLQVDLVGPLPSQVRGAINLDPRITYIATYVPPNAVLSRHHFDARMPLGEYTSAYINDPMQLRNYQALLKGRCEIFTSHNHFIDNPSCPKFGGILWLGQCEAVQRADVNFWQCQSAREVFEADYGAKVENSHIWDDGYSIAEITSPINMANVRFDPALLTEKPIIFVPNRVGGRGRSSDYTNCGKFLFELVPQLRKIADFAVVAGNPSQKFSNKELVDECGVLPLTVDAFTRDEYKLVATHSKIAVALYDQDTYGGTAIRECIELGCLPLWLDCNEYRSLSKAANYPHTCTWETLVPTCAQLLHMDFPESLRQAVRQHCSIEATTLPAARRLHLL